MSTISAISQGINQFLQNISANQQSQTQNASSGPTAAGASVVATAGQQQVHGSGHHHHHGGRGGGGFFQKIEQAVTSALQSAPSGSDPNQTIQNAIAQVLQANGATSSNASASTASSTVPGSVNPPGGSAQSSSSASANNGSGPQAFFQLLQTYGIDPRQFREDFLGAINSALGGQNGSSSAAVSSIPNGLVVDSNA